MADFSKIPARTPEGPMYEQATKAIDKSLNTVLRALLGHSKGDNDGKSRRITFNPKASIEDRIGALMRFQEKLQEVASNSKPENAQMLNALADALGDKADRYDVAWSKLKASINNENEIEPRSLAAALRDDSEIFEPRRGVRKILRQVAASKEFNLIKEADRSKPVTAAQRFQGEIAALAKGGEQAVAERLVQDSGTTNKKSKKKLRAAAGLPDPVPAQPAPALPQEAPVMPKITLKDTSQKKGVSVNPPTTHKMTLSDPQVALAQLAQQQGPPAAAMGRFGAGNLGIPAGPQSAATGAGSLQGRFGAMGASAASAAAGAAAPAAALPPAAQADPSTIKKLMAWAMGKIDKLDPKTRKWVKALGGGALIGAGAAVGGAIAQGITEEFFGVGPNARAHQDRMAEMPTGAEMFTQQMAQMAQMRRAARAMQQNPQLAAMMQSQMAEQQAYGQSMGSDLAPGQRKAGAGRMQAGPPQGQFQDPEQLLALLNGGM